MLRTTLPILPPQSPVLKLWVGITQFSPKSNLHLTATVPLAAARLLFNSGERRVFLLCRFPFLKRKKKEKKSKCYKGVLEPHPSEALSAWHRPSVFLLHIFTHPELWELHVQLWQTHPFHLHSPVFVLVPHPKSEVSRHAGANAWE